MSRIMVALLLLAFAVSGLALTARAQQEPTPTPEPQPRSAPARTNCPPERILVKVRAGSDPAAVVGRYGGTIVQTIPGIEVQVVTVPAGTRQQAIDALNADPDVQYAEPDGEVRALGGDDGCQ